MRHSLDDQNILPEWIDKDDGNPYSPGVKFCTLYSSKGLEFDFVIILDLDKPRLDENVDTEEYWEVEQRLLYVGITKAITFVQLYYCGKASRLLHDWMKVCMRKLMCKSGWLIWYFVEK